MFLRMIQHCKALKKENEALCLKILRVLQQTLELDTNYEEKVCDYKRIQYFIQIFHILVH